MDIFKRAGLRNIMMSLALFMLCGLFTFLKPQNVKADDLPTVYLSGTLSSSSTWSAGNVYYINNITVPSGVTLTIQAGAIVKVGGSGITVSTGGTLNVEGTGSNEVLFTSHRDDSAGGDSDENGPHDPQPSEFSAAISPNGGTIEVAYAHFKYGSFAIDDINVGHDPAVVSINDSEFNTVGGVRTYYPILLQRNHFAVTDGIAIAAYNEDVTGIVLSGNDKNIFVGTGNQRVIDTYRATVPVNKTWTIDAGPTVIAGYQFTIRGTLNLQPGLIVKVGGGGDGITVASGGALHINGNSMTPVTVTSIKDASIGGDSTGDGNRIPSAGDYQSAVYAQTGSDINVSYAQVTYATSAFKLYGHTQISDTTISNVVSGVETYDMDGDFKGMNIHDVHTGISVWGDSKLTYRGTITNADYKAIASCKWSQNCNIDAAYTDWGSTNGPFLSNGSAVVCGRVTVSPWVSGSSSPGNMFNVKNCDNSPTPSEQLSASIQTYQQAVNNSKIQCDNGFQDACQQISRTFACVDAAIGLATTNSPFALPGSSASESAATYAGDMVSASSTYINGIEEASPAAFSTSVMGGVASVLGIFTGLINAYNSCT